MASPWLHALPGWRPGASPAPAGSFAQQVAGPVRHAQPLGVLTTLTAGGALAYTALMLPRPWLAMDAEDRWVEAAAEGRSAYDVMTPYELVDLVGFAVLLGTFVVTCAWLWRARTNVEALSPSAPQARRRGWVWAGWFVPVVALWFPFQVVRDALRIRSHHPSWLSRVGWWWGAFLVVLLLMSVEAAFVPWDAIDPADVSPLSFFAILSTIGFVVLCVLWLRVVRSVARDQDDLFAAAR